MELNATVFWMPAEPARASARETAPPANRESDESLMLRYGDGDDAAFRELYARYRARLLRFAQRLTGRTSEAEEIFQETWIAVIDSRARYTVRARFITWIFAIAHRRAADRSRNRARRPIAAWDARAGETPDLATHEPPERAIADARQRALVVAIAALPFEQREVFLLRAETGLGLRDIAAITHALPETTRSRLRYALRALSRAMAEWT